MGSAGIFLNVINAFNIFLLSNCGILVADYFFVVKGQVDADCLYDRRPDGPYYFWRGLNWRAFLAYTVAIAMVSRLKGSPDDRTFQDTSRVSGFCIMVKASQDPTTLPRTPARLSPGSCTGFSAATLIRRRIGLANSKSPKFMSGSNLKNMDRKRHLLTDWRRKILLITSGSCQLSSERWLYCRLGSELRTL